MNPGVELANLARRINGREQAIEAMRLRTIKSVNETLCEVLLQGQDLIKSKAHCHHGAWLYWLAANCPKISLRRAQRYMSLADKAESIPNLREADTLRAALALCDLEGESSDDKKARGWPAYQEAILRLSKLRGYVDRNPIQSWPREGLEKFREDLEPIARSLWPERFGLANR